MAGPATTPCAAQATATPSTVAQTTTL
ncbi:hypothetical protein R2601_04463 [Salipiger bermudensis HTCC2601]|uniref:Uncharacterized protein n=1 Tax=Salipiger bermudensis (strain DSM 26914 / JCM 13377 / KCTC 12554 / HTCC2601) TaxID=314265 RepID=Q0FVV3_SALBH|nr:hypothetical protein R2601_04463 [Salipiger bermudensis HTCC2601]